MARLVDTGVADVFRDGLEWERHELSYSPEPERQDVLARRDQWEREITTWRRRIERLQGRIEADNQWLAEHPDGAMS
jgi:hypothetical protein